MFEVFRMKMVIEMGKGFLKFKRKLSEILAEYKEEEKRLEQKAMN